MRPAIFLSLLLSIPTRAFGEAGWTEPANITSLESNIFGRILVELDLRKNPSSCKEQNRFFREDTGENSRRMLDILLQAASDRLKVRLRVSGACHLKGYTEFNAVALVP